MLIVNNFCPTLAQILEWIRKFEVPPGQLNALGLLSVKHPEVKGVASGGRRAFASSIHVRAPVSRKWRRYRLRPSSKKIPRSQERADLRTGEINLFQKEILSGSNGECNAFSKKIPRFKAADL